MREYTQYNHIWIRAAFQPIKCLLQDQPKLLISIELYIFKIHRVRQPCWPSPHQVLPSRLGVHHVVLFSCLVGYLASTRACATFMPYFVEICERLDCRMILL